MFRIGKDWGPLLSSEYTQPYFKSLEGFIASEYLNNKCFPPKDQIFNAFNLCAFKDLKVSALKISFAVLTSSLLMIGFAIIGLALFRL